MQKIITATTATGEQREFYVNLSTQGPELVAEAERFAGKGGHIEVTQRERLNDYVGSPVWSDEHHIGGWDV